MADNQPDTHFDTVGIVSPGLFISQIINSLCSSRNQIPTAGRAEDGRCDGMRRQVGTEDGESEGGESKRKGEEKGRVKRE